MTANPRSLGKNGGLPAILASEGRERNIFRASSIMEMIPNIKLQHTCADIHETMHTYIHTCITYTELDGEKRKKEKNYTSFLSFYQLIFASLPPTGLP